MEKEQSEEVKKEVQLVTLDQVINWKLDLILERIDNLEKLAKEE